MSGGELEQFRDGHVPVGGVTEGAVQAEGVVAASPVAFMAKVAGLCEVGDDVLGGAWVMSHRTATSRIRVCSRVR